MKPNFKILNLPDLIEIQRSSYCWFLTNGLSSILEVFSLLCTSEGEFRVQIFGGDYVLEQPQYDLFETKNRDGTYASPIIIPINILYSKNVKKDIKKKPKYKGKSRKRWVILGDLPLMTNHGTFIINGCERIVVNQIIRNPGLYLQKKRVRKNHYDYNALLIPNRGSWLKFEFKKRKHSPETLATRIKKKKIKEIDSDEKKLKETCFNNERISLDREKLKLFRKEKKIRENRKKKIRDLCLIIDKQHLYPVEYIFKWIKDNETYGKRERDFVHMIYSLKNKSNVDSISSFVKENIYSTFDQTFSTPASSAYYFLRQKYTYLDEKERDTFIQNIRYADLNTKDFENELLASIYFTIPFSLKKIKRYKQVPTFLKNFTNKGHVPIQPPIDELIGDIAETSFLIEDYNLLHSQNKSYLYTQRDFATFNKIERRFSRLFSHKYYDLSEIGRIKLNKKIGLNLSPKITILTIQDFFLICERFIKFLQNPHSELDDIDNLKNRRVRSIGELLQNQIYSGLKRLEKSIYDGIEKRKEEKTFTFDEVEIIDLINTQPLTPILKEFFGSGQLSQFMDQTNPLAELTHRRRITGLGPGGFNKDHVSIRARDIHPSQYGRICPIETSEGQNVGLVTSLASYARIGKYGRIEAPYYKVVNGTLLTDRGVFYMSSDIEENFKIASGDMRFDSFDAVTNENVLVRYNQGFKLVNRVNVNFADISPIQVLSISTSLIPFVEHDDANRALMGSNMQRQAIPLLYPRKAIVGTGLETQIAINSELTLLAYKSGKVESVTSDQIIIEEISGKKRSYLLRKYIRSNQGTCINQRPVVWPGEYVLSGQILADGPATQDGEIALGQNLVVAYLPWEGYNYEDAILISENLIYENLLTSIHIEKYDIKVKETKNGPEELTTDIPDVSEEAVKHLDHNGIVLKGTYVVSGDILVGKVTLKEEAEELPEARLLKAIFGIEASPAVFDSSFRLKSGSGRVIDIRIFIDENGDPVPHETYCLVRIFLAKIKRIEVGDKIAGRHGNKGIISNILPIEDMPFMPNGRHIDLILNPLGVPSRMNVGQIFECLLGFAGDHLNKRFKILPFDEMYEQNASRILITKQLKKAAFYSKQDWIFNPYYPGKVLLKDGRTGEPFDNPITVGKTYILKLIHLVSHKIHARSTGPYSLVTQQPLQGRAMHGGQRFGEMEVWALEAFGAAYTLQELMTIKSDDIEGRNSIVQAITQGKQIPQPGVPESFRVLVKELRSLGLDIGAYKLRKLKNLNLEYKEVDLYSSRTQMKQVLNKKLLKNAKI
uniref:DNA-directed RNA polymerase subunit beta n=1 Tax=Olisthodiscus luteus TaxID=83000 RepID=A0A7U0KSP6_OLILU|nr:RNA polymerase subunit beta [Olisthodiscus luteus]QQW50524.1 RNA polymerase subunit beta [Olisthodiscus luteus]